MIYTIFDDSVSPLMNVFLVIGNVIALVYNIPQMVKTYKTKSTKDFSSIFLFMRIINNSIWLSYSIELGTFLFILANITAVIGSTFLGYYKLVELYDIRTIKKKELYLIAPEMEHTDLEMEHTDLEMEHTDLEMEHTDLEM